MTSLEYLAQQGECWMSFPGSAGPLRSAALPNFGLRPCSALHQHCQAVFCWPAARVLHYCFGSDLAFVGKTARGLQLSGLALLAGDCQESRFCANWPPISPAQCYQLISSAVATGVAPSDSAASALPRANLPLARSACRGS